MSVDYIVVGHFRFVDDTKSAILRMKEKGYSDLTLYSPAPNHELEEELYRGKKRSPISRYTLFGGLSGCLGGYLMTIWMSIDWPLRTSAKPIISIPAFTIIAFECTILIGAIFTLMGLLHLCRIPNIAHNPAYRENFSKDTFGLVVRVPKDQAEGVKQEIADCGAQEVEVQYVR